MQTGLIALVIIFFLVYGIPKIIAEIRKGNKPEMNEEGTVRFRSLEIEKGHSAVEKILGEMRTIAEVTLALYDSFCKNKHTRMERVITHFSGEQKYLIDEMDKNVRAEWVPRFEHLKGIRYSFKDNAKLNNAFTDFERIDKDIRKCQETHITSAGINESFGKAMEVVYKSAAIGAIGGIAVAGVTMALINKGGKQIGGHNFDPYTGKRL